MGRRGPRHGGGGGGGGGSSGYGGPGAAPAATPAAPQIVTEEHPPVKGPHPGFVSVAGQYTVEQQLRRMQRDNGCDPSREDSYRLQGVQLIDNVRESLQLPVKTFATACTYYHKFRLNFRDAEYNFQDAALSALFVACKVEDTIKKSRDVLCAAYNLKNPDKPTTPDDKIFERPSTIIVGLDRLILQTVGFDFRVRYPQKLLAKLIRKSIPAEDAKFMLSVAYPMSIDLYKTFAPIKQTSFTMALAVIELTALITDKHVDTVRAVPLEQYHTNRGCVVETILDLLDLYTQFRKSTKIGMRFDLDRFIDIKIRTNQDVDENPALHRIESWCDKCGFEDKDANPTITPGSATSPATSGSWPPGGGLLASKSNQKRPEGTMRFVFEAEKMRQEQAEVAEYFKEEYSEYDTEVEEVIPDQPQNHGSHNGHNYNNNNNGSGGGRGGRRDRNHHQQGRNNNNNNQNNGNIDSGWGGGQGPYHRNRNHDNRRKPRKGGGYY